MKKQRRVAKAAAALVAPVALLAPFGASGAVAEAASAPAITRVAGALGAGPARSVAMQTPYITASGHRIYVSDSATNVIRLVDVTSGQESVVAGDGSNGRNVADGSPATSGAVLPGALTIAPDGSLVFVDYPAPWGSLGGQRIRRIGTAGVLSTLAGNGTYGLSGDGGPATSAAFSNMNQIGYDASGDLLVADQANCRVRKITPAGTVTTLAGTVCGYSHGLAPDGTPAATAQLGPVPGVAVDTSGVVYFSDQTSCVVRRIDASGNLVTVAGTGTCGTDSGDGGPATAASLLAPSTIAVDGSGNVYITDYQGRVRKVGGTGTITTFAGGGTSTADGVPATSSTGLYDLAFSQGLVYGGADRRVRVVDRDGLISTAAGNGRTATSGDGGPAAAAQVDDGAIAIRGGVLTVAGDSVLRTIDTSGTITSRSLSGPAASDITDYQGGMAEDPAGNVYVASFQNDIVKVDPGGVATLVLNDGGFFLTVEAADGSGDIYYTFAGGSPSSSEAGIAKLDPSTGQVTELYREDNGTAPVPRAAAVGPNGQVVFSSGCQVLMIVAPETSVTPATTVPVAGNGTCGYAGDGGPATSAELDNMYALAFDHAGHLFIADYENHRVRQVSSGTITTVAGNGTPELTGDGGPATSAALDEVTGLATDSSGNVYIADRYRIREIHLGG